MKKVYLFMLILIVLTGCKVKINPPDCYYQAKQSFENKDYESVIAILEKKHIKISIIITDDTDFVLSNKFSFNNCIINDEEDIDEKDFILLGVLMLLFLLSPSLFIVLAGGLLSPSFICGFLP